MGQVFFGNRLSGIPYMNFNLIFSPIFRIDINLPRFLHMMNGILQIVHQHFFHLEFISPKIEILGYIYLQLNAFLLKKNIHIAEYDPEDSDEINVVSPLLEEKNSKPSPELSDKTATTEQAVDLEPENVNEKVKMHKQPVVGVPDKAIVEPVKVESTPGTKTAQAVEKAEKQPAQDARKAQQDEPKLEQKSEDKVDPENPEIDIRPIEDPMPDNIRAS